MDQSILIKGGMDNFEEIPGFRGATRWYQRGGHFFVVFRSSGLSTYLRCHNHRCPVTWVLRAGKPGPIKGEHDHEPTPWVRNRNILFQALKRRASSETTPNNAIYEEEAARYPDAAPYLLYESVVSSMRTWRRSVVTPEPRIGNMTSVSVNQLSALIDFLESNRELALGNFNSSTEGRRQARPLWDQCSILLNSVSANCVQKTPNQWRLYYNEYKSTLLKKIKMEKAQMSATGRGPSRSKKLTPLQERLYNILGRDVGEPLPGVRHNPLAVSQSYDSQAPVEVSQALLEVVQIPLAENSQNVGEEMVQMVDDDVETLIHVWEIPDLQHQVPEVGPSMSQEANRMPEPSPPTTTHAPRQADSPAPRQTVPPAPRRRRRRVQRRVNRSEHDSMHEALEQSAAATRKLAQATQRLTAAVEAIAERLREPIIIVLQHPPQAP